MVKFDGTYKNDKNENLLELLLNAEVPEARAQAIAGDKGKITIKNEGNTFSYKYEGTAAFESKVIVGEEVEEPLFTGVGKSSTKIEGNVVTITTVDKTKNRKLVRVYTFSDAGMEVVLLYNNLKATRYYTRL